MDKIIRYYAQNGEDYILTQFFKNKKEGFFVDVGAFDGVHLSNSYCFEQLGWEGICVEPNSYYHDKCKEVRRQTECFNVACVDTDHTGEIEMEFDPTGLFSSAVFDKSQNNIKDHYGTIGLEINNIQTVSVKAMTLNDILDKSSYKDKQIDFLSIDVEGLEINVLNGFDLNKYLPTVLLIETSTDKDQTTITEYLKVYDYIFARRVGANSFFVKNENDIERINNIELTCVLEKQMHSLGTKFTQKEYLEGKIIYKGKNGNSLLVNSEKEIINLNRIIEEAKISSQEKVKELVAHIENEQKLRRELIEEYENKLKENNKF